MSEDNEMKGGTEFSAILTHVFGDCPKAYGGCMCPCHRMPGVKHCVPCCYPQDETQKELNKLPGF